MTANETEVFSQLLALLCIINECILFVFMLALLCFCVATELSANKDFINVHSRSNYREFLIALVGD